MTVSLNTKSAFAAALVLAASTVFVQPASARTAQEYTVLAERYKPTTRSEQQMIQEYMRLPAGQQGAYASRHPGTSASIWDFGPYAVCFYASVAGGADVVEAGDECHEKWVD